MISSSTHDQFSSWTAPSSSSMNYCPPIEELEGEDPPYPSLLSVLIESVTEREGGTNQTDDPDNNNNNTTTSSSSSNNSLVDSISLSSRIAREAEILPDDIRLQITLDVEGRNQICQVDSAQLAEFGLESLGRELVKVVRDAPHLVHLMPALESEFTKDPQLRLKMLRAEHYNVERAAVRFANFLNLLLEVFGPSMLRSIHLTDLSEEDRQLQRRGAQQLFRFRDRSGRRIAGCFDVDPPGSATTASQVGTNDRK
jgi:hypothetical protein